MHTSKCPKGGSSLICIKNHSLMKDRHYRERGIERRQH